MLPNRKKLFFIYPLFLLLLLPPLTPLNADKTFDLGEEKVMGQNETSIEIEEVGNSEIADYIFKTDLYTNQEKNQQKVIDKLFEKQGKNKKGRSKNSDNKRSRIQKKKIYAQAGSFETVKIGGEFEILNQSKDEFKLNLNYLQSEGYRKENDNRQKFGSGIHWEREFNDQKNLKVQGFLNFQNKDLPGPENNPQMISEIEEAIQGILINYELTKNVSDRLSLSAGVKKSDRDLKGELAQENKKATSGHLEADFFTFIQSKYSGHLGGALHKDTLEGNAGTSINGDHWDIHGGFEGLMNKDWSYTFKLQSRNYQDFGTWLFPGLYLQKVLGHGNRLSVFAGKEVGFQSFFDTFQNYEDLNLNSVDLPTKRRIKVETRFEKDLKTKYSLGLFHDDYESYLAIEDRFDPTLGLSRYWLQSLKGVEVYGLNAGLEHHLNNHFTFSSDLLFQEINDDSLGREVSFLPNQKHSFKLAYNNGKGFTADATRVLVGGFPTLLGNPSGGVGRSQLTHLGLGFEKNSNLQFDFKIRNLYDESYEFRRDQPGPGREFQLELKTTY